MLAGEFHETSMSPAGRVSEFIHTKLVTIEGTYAIKIATSSERGPSPWILTPEYLNR